MLYSERPNIEPSFWRNGSRHPGEVAWKFRHQAADGGIIITNNQHARLLEMAKIKYGIAQLRVR